MLEPQYRRPVYHAIHIGCLHPDLQPPCYTVINCVCVCVCVCLREIETDRERQRGRQREIERLYIVYTYMAYINTENFWKAAKKLLGICASGEWG